MAKLNLDRDKVDRCRELADGLIHPIQKYIDLHSTVSVERSVVRLLGCEDATDTPFGTKMPLANILVEKLDRNRLSMGVATWIGAALIEQPKLPVYKLAQKVAEGAINLNNFPEPNPDQVRKVINPLVGEAAKRVDRSRHSKDYLRQKFARVRPPLRYVIVATGNIYEDVKQAVAASRKGADVIAVIRSTAQSLLDYVPHGATTEGFGGTYATQENFRIMRKALNDVSYELKRYIRLCNYSSGLCMPEIAVMGAFEDLDFLLNDAFYGILFRDINMKRTFVDQYFSRTIIARAGITINTGEDNYLTTADAYHNHHQVLASHFINEQFGKRAGLKEEQIGLGHAFEMDPSIEDSFIYELAMAQLVRDVFQRHPIKYMPPTRHMTGNIFQGHVLDALFNLAGAATNQQIQLLGMPTEAIHNPLLQDRHLSLQNADYVFTAAGSLADEIQFNPNGKLVRRARTVLDNTLAYLEKIRQIGLMEAIEQGMFAEMPRARDGGKGLEGVFQKSRRYYNPFLESASASSQRGDSRR
ncbi:MAG: lysine 5,6-aminomutase subunit alpha [Deltaproteobacteria bacterium]|nr:lysine 5,6-aminomutase subunit alpha [Deltaproteobacteria bacterium]